MDPLLIGIVLLLLGSGKKGASSSVPSKTTRTDPATDGAVLLARANQPAAKKWAIIFRSQDQPALVADALARWAGIESSGNPLEISSKGERGLFQCMQATALQAAGPYTYQEWEALSAKTTTSEEQARLAIKLYRWCWTKAKKLIANAPTAALDTIWYAKLFHQFPKDVKEAKLHGPATLMARELATAWKADNAKSHRLRAANVVAFGVPNP